MNPKNRNIIVFVILILAVVGALVLSPKKKEPVKQQQAEQTYAPHINPAEFTSKITNKYFSLQVGKKLVYEGNTKDGPEKIEIQITGETKTIAGVTTLLYWDRVWLNGTLHEDTKDWLAQDKAGNVWYFGEEVDNYTNGAVSNHSGSWLAGVDGAQPGIWIKSKQKVGDSYKQEYYKGKAEDMARVVAVGQTVTTKRAVYTGCVKVYEWTPLNPQSKENKYYCPQVGAQVLVEDLTEETKSELTNIISP